jgi:hypothetical protein
MSPDFTQDYLPLTEVVDWMTTLDSKTAFKRKNILEQIRRAIKKKEIPTHKWKDRRRSVEIRPLFTWTATKKGWAEELKKVSGLPIDVTVNITGVKGEGETHKVYVGDVRDARIAVLEEEINQVKALNATLLQAIKIRSEKARFAGKQGGRGNTK